jgi:hypothetical protein
MKYWRGSVQDVPPVPGGNRREGVRGEAQRLETCHENLSMPHLREARLVFSLGKRIGGIVRASQIRPPVERGWLVTSAQKEQLEAGIRANRDPVGSKSISSRPANIRRELSHRG